jgi:hypothetical protein
MNQKSENAVNPVWGWWTNDGEGNICSSLYLVEHGQCASYCTTYLHTYLILRAGGIAQW